MKENKPVIEPPQAGFTPFWEQPFTFDRVIRMLIVLILFSEQSCWSMRCARCCCPFWWHGL